MKRLIDPFETIRIDMDRRQGIRTQRGIVTDVRRVQRSGSVPTPQRHAEALTWYRANIGGSGDAAYLMRRGYPSSDSAWAQANTQIILPNAGRIVGGRLEVSPVDACTAGTAQLRLRLIDGNRTSDIDLDFVILSLANPITIAKTWRWEKAKTYGFSARTTIEARCVTAGTWAPTSSDVQAVVFVEYDA